MSIKLVAIDIDDTLLNSKGELLSSTINAVKSVMEHNIKVVLCTGRPLAGVKNYLNDLGIEGNEQYVITYNGAVIESVAGHIINTRLVDNAHYRSLTDFGQKHDIPFNVLDNMSTIYTANQNVNRMTVIQAWENNAGILIRTPSEMPADFEIAKGLFVGEKDLLDKVEPLIVQTFAKELYIVRSSINFLEVMNLSVNKGQALKYISSILNINADEVMAIGDEKNDIPMFNFAGLAVAMKNGSELAKKHADYITDTNDSDGLAKALQKSILNKIK